MVTLDFERADALLTQQQGSEWTSIRAKLTDPAKLLQAARNSLTIVNAHNASELGSIALDANARGMNAVQQLQRTIMRQSKTMSPVEEVKAKSKGSGKRSKVTECVTGDEKCERGAPRCEGKHRSKENSLHRVALAAVQLTGNCSTTLSLSLSLPLSLSLSLSLLFLRRSHYPMQICTSW